ncbi:hypothetical protein D3C76_913800 [compost metagenome]
MNPHRHALGQPYPVEGRVDVGDQLAAFRVVAVVDAAGNTLHMALEHFTAHHLQVSLVTDIHMRQLGLLEEAIDPERIFIDHCHLRLAGTRIVAAVHVEVGHVAIDGGENFGPLEVQLSRRQLRLRMLIVGQRRVGDVAGVVAVLAGDHQVVHVRTPVGVDLAHFPGGLA